MPRKILGACWLPGTTGDRVRPGWYLKLEAERPNSYRLRWYGADEPKGVPLEVWKNSKWVTHQPGEALPC